MNKKVVSCLILLLVVPAVTIGGYYLFPDRGYIWVSVCVTLLSCLPFFISFERKMSDVRKIVLLAAMVALSVFGRFAFSYIPHFKPVTAIVILTGIYLGGESGFLCGALSVMLSNILFGQGPWTPFQMVAWGLIGFFAGLLAVPFKKHISLLLLYGALSGVFYSLFMDILTVLWIDGTVNPAKYLATIVSSLPVTAVYVFSNIVFLFCLVKPLGKKIERVITKYGL